MIGCGVILENMTISDIPSLVKQTFLKASAPMNITSGFYVSGINPLNTNIFDDWKFAPYAATDCSMSQLCEQDAAKAIEDVSDSRTLPSIITAMEPLPSSSTANESFTSTAVEPIPSTSTSFETVLSIFRAVETKPSLITDEAETSTNVGESSLCPEKITPHPKATLRKKIQYR